MDARTVALIRALREAKEADCQVVFPWGQTIHLGDGTPRFQLVLQNERLLQSQITELSLGRAYVQGDVDIKLLGKDRQTVINNAMSVFRVRDAVRSGTSVGQVLRLAAELALSRPTRVNARAIQYHYSLGDDFYHTFLDPKYHFYSQCMFEDACDEELELEKPEDALIAAAKQKLNHMEKALALKKDMRILDIGAGWGGLTEYCNDLGVHVTSLTLSDDSAKYIREHTKDRHSEVLVEDLLEHRRREYYDGVVIFGVVEHIPTYARLCRRVWDALKPGRRLYMDASATKQKYAASAFTRRYTWQGPHSCLALPDMIEELLFNGFEIVDVHRGTRDYERTMRAWALRLDHNHNEIAARWGEHVYRTFRVFLWGGVAGFHTNRLQAYTLVAERRDDHGPRPSRLRRAGHFAASLR
jgi:cyclopropane-fatty-acyl-phospholipid synthase